MNRLCWLFVTAIAIACDSTAPSPRIVSFELNVDTATVAVGATRQLTATARGGDGQIVTPPSISWSASDTNIARVTASGLVTGRAIGRVSVHASVGGGIEASANIKVAIPRAALQFQTVLGTPLRSVWGRNASDVYAVGENIIAHYNGSAWQTSSSSYAPTDVWASGPDSVLLTGRFGHVLRRAGNTWTFETPGDGKSLWGIWGTARANVFIVGDSGSVYRFDGAAWIRESTGTTRHLYAVWGTGSTVFAVGGFGTILHRTAAGWQAAQIPSRFAGTDFYAVHGTSLTHVIAVGQNGAVLRFDGSVWTWVDQVSLLDPGDIFGVWMSGRGDGYAASDNGLIHFDGVEWVRVPASPGLTDVWGASDDEIFAINEFGQIYRAQRQP